TGINHYKKHTVEFSNNERTPTQDTHTGHPTSGQPLHLTISSVSPPGLMPGGDPLDPVRADRKTTTRGGPCRSASDRPSGPISAVIVQRRYAVRSKALRDQPPDRCPFLPCGPTRDNITPPPAHRQIYAVPPHRPS